jgi:hypothetical protein
MEVGLPSLMLGTGSFEVTLHFQRAIPMPPTSGERRTPGQEPQVAGEGGEGVCASVLQPSREAFICQHERAGLLKMKGMMGAGRSPAPIIPLHHWPKGQGPHRQLRMLRHTPWRMDE